MSMYSKDPRDVWDGIDSALTKSGHLPVGFDISILDNALFYEFGRHFHMASRCLRPEDMFKRPPSIFQFVELADLLGDE